MRLTLDVEAQQSFDFLSDQVQGLRKAFSTLSDVLIEEVDLIRSEASGRHADLQQQNGVTSNSIKAVKTEILLLRSEADTSKAAAEAKINALEERIELLQEDMTMLAQEVAKGGSANHLMQLEVVQLRSQFEEECRNWKVQHETEASKLCETIDRLDSHQHDARVSMQALDSDIGSLRTQTEQLLTTHKNAIEANKAKLLQSAQAIEKLWSSTKLQQQRLDSMGSGAFLQYQQLSDRFETISKQHLRWRTTLEEAIKAVAADVQLVQTHARTMEAAIGSNKAEARRLIGEHEGELQRQNEVLGRAIHSMADTLNLTPPLIGHNAQH